MRVMQTSRLLAVYFWAMVIYLIFPIIIVLPVSFQTRNCCGSRQPRFRCAGISPISTILSGSMPR